MKLTGTDYCHSADIRMHLRLNGHVLPIAQLGRDFLVLKTPIDYPPSIAEITISVDGRERSWEIDLPQGLKPTVRKSPIMPAQGTNGTSHQ